MKSDMHFPQKKLHCKVNKQKPKKKFDEFGKVVYQQNVISRCELQTNTVHSTVFL